jgi:hypothetical protein
VFALSDFWVFTHTLCLRSSRGFLVFLSATPPSRAAAHSTVHGILCSLLATSYFQRPSWTQKTNNPFNTSILAVSPAVHAVHRITHRATCTTRQHCLPDPPQRIRFTLPLSTVHGKKRTLRILISSALLRRVLYTRQTVLYGIHVRVASCFVPLVSIMSLTRSAARRTRTRSPARRSSQAPSGGVSKTP